VRCESIKTAPMEVVSQVTARTVPQLSKVEKNPSRSSQSRSIKIWEVREHGDHTSGSCVLVKKQSGMPLLFKDGKKIHQKSPHKRMLTCEVRAYPDGRNGSCGLRNQLEFHYV
jgi:hypothetical protein